MTKKLLVVVSLLAVGIAYGQTEAKAIKTMFDRQTAAANKGDVTAYMATIDPESPNFAQTQKAMAAVFQAYKLKFVVESYKLVSLQGKTASIETTMLTTKVSGPKFRNNRIKMTSAVVKKGGKWLLTSSKIEDIKYL